MDYDYLIIEMFRLNLCLLPIVFMFLPIMLLMSTDSEDFTLVIPSWVYFGEVILAYDKSIIKVGVQGFAPYIKIKTISQLCGINSEILKETKSVLIINQ